MFMFALNQYFIYLCTFISVLRQISLPGHKDSHSEAEEEAETGDKYENGAATNKKSGGGNGSNKTDEGAVSYTIIQTIARTSFIQKFSNSISVFKTSNDIINATCGLLGPAVSS